MVGIVWIEAAQAGIAPLPPFGANPALAPIFTSVSRDIPRATVRRLPAYLRYLAELPAGRQTVSSDDIAEGSGVTAAQVRKDLSFLESTTGTRGVGYEAPALRQLISRALGLGQSVPVALVGAGNLGRALAGYGGFDKLGFHISGIYDVGGIGETVGGVEVRPVDRLAEDAADQEFAVGIIATPASSAQEVAGILVGAGVRAILNFAPAVVTVPPGVTVRQVDLATELQILSYYLSH